MKKIKLTNKQYKRLFVTESIVDGGLNRVNKTVKKEIPDLKEDESNDYLVDAISSFLKNVWLSSAKISFSKIFADMGLSYEEIIDYLVKNNVIGLNKGGIYSVKNYFNKSYNKDDAQAAIKEKSADIDKIAEILAVDKKAPWNHKVKNPNKAVKAEDISDGSPYPPGTENDPNAPWNQSNDNLHNSTAPKIFSPLGFNYELAILKGPDGNYVFFYGDIPREQFPNQEYELDIEDIVDYVNENITNLSRGEGIADFEAGKALVKIDEELKNDLLGIYSKDKGIVKALSTLSEMTSAASSGAFTAPLSLKPEDALEETTTTASSGAYVQPAIWAKDKKSWKAGNKTQYPKGEMVKLDSCTKLNNNKKAQNGKCSQGAADGVVKTYKTKKSVISKNAMYETIAKKTGRSVEDIQNIIENKLNNDKSLA